MFDFAKFFANARAAVPGKIVPAALQATNQFAQGVIADAKELCPVMDAPHGAEEPGELKASGTVQPAEMRGSNVSCVVGFDAPYAAFVHENLDAHHQTGQAKFLEDALKAKAPQYGPFVANAIKAAMG